MNVAKGGQAAWEWTNPSIPQTIDEISSRRTLRKVFSGADSQPLQHCDTYVQRGPWRCRNFGSPRQRLTAASSQRVVNDPGRCLCAGGSTIVTALIVPKSGGVTSTKVNVVRWLKREGEPVKSGEAIVELETEKVSYELESPAAGVLLKIIAGETTEVPVGDPLGYIGQPGETIPTS